MFPKATNVDCYVICIFLLRGWRSWFLVDCKYVCIFVRISVCTRGGGKMKIVTTREIVRQAKEVFELAERERVAVKRGKKYVNLIVTDEPDTNFVSQKWIKEFMSIPMQYRCDPFEFSPSGDLFYADKRNVERLEQAIKTAKDQIEKDEVTQLKTKEELDTFFDSL